MKGINFNLKPLETPKEAPKVDENKQISFELDFTNFIRQYSNPIPNADATWKTIMEHDDNVSYTQLIHMIDSCTDYNDIKIAFQKKCNPTTQLQTDLKRHLAYFRQIITYEQLYSLATMMVLEYNQFLSTLSQDQAIKFKCALQILAKSLTKMQTYEEKQELLTNFSRLMLPMCMQMLGDVNVLISALTFIPVQDEINNKFWLILMLDRKCYTLLIAKDTPRVMEFALKQLTPEWDNEKIQFCSAPGKPVFTYKFLTEDGAELWKMAYSGTSLPLETFIACMPAVAQFPEFLPREFIEQMKNILSDQRLEFVRSVSSIAVESNQLEAFGELLSFMNLQGALLPFIRDAFNNEIPVLKDVNLLYRGNTVAPKLAGVVLAQCAQQFTESIIDSLAQTGPELSEVIEKIVNTNDSGVTPPMHYIFFQTFRAVRRRFPDRLLPLKGISSILMLRYLMPKFATLSPVARVKAQKLTQAFVFSKDSPIEEKDYKAIAKFVLQFGNCPNGGFTFPEPKICSIGTFMGPNSKKIIDKYLYERKKLATPLFWTIYELVENIILSGPESFDNLLATTVINPALSAQKVEQ